MDSKIFSCQIHHVALIFHLSHPTNNQTLELWIFSVAEKIPHMEEWWTTAHGRMIKAKLHKNVIEKAVEDSALILRENEDDFFKLFEDNQVPILLFSAGISQIVQFAMVYKAKEGFTENMKGNCASKVIILAIISVISTRIYGS